MVLGGFVNWAVDARFIIRRPYLSFGDPIYVNDGKGVNLTLPVLFPLGILSAKISFYLYHIFGYQTEYS